MKLVVVSRKGLKILDKNHIVVSSPKEAFKELKDFEEIIVAGGGNLNTSFMKDNLIDEIYLDIEPILIGKGIKLFEGGDFEANLRLLNVKNVSDVFVKLHYEVLG